MSLPNCIPGLIADGKIRKSDGDAAEKAFRRHYGRLSEAMSPEAAAAEASERTVADMEYATELQRRRAGLQIKAQQRFDVAAAAAEAKGMRPHRFLKDRLRAVEGATIRIENQAHQGISDFIQRHRRDLLGRPHDKAGLFDVVRERHGQKTGNANAKLFSDAIGDVMERGRLRFNRAGGDVRFRADFGLPHQHDALRVRAAPFETWRGDILAEIAPDRMVDPLSGGRFTPDRLEEFLRASYDNIRANGLTDPNGVGGGAAKMLANRRSDPRFFVFKDGDAWLRYAEKYGTGNPFETIIEHVHGLARDIAMMEEFGPNPAATWKRGMHRADVIEAGGDEALAGTVKGTSAGKYLADKMWRYMNGDLTVPVLPDGKWTGRMGRFALSTFEATRDVLTSAFLGSAQVTSIGDMNTSAFARKMNDLPVTGAFMGYLKQLNMFDATDRKRAIYLGAGMRDATRALISLSRFYGETHSPRWSQVLADGVLRVTGMNKWFEAGQRAFVDDFLGQLASERHLPFGQLSEDRRFGFAKYNIGPEDWDAMRASQPYRDGGAEWLDWHQVAKTDEGAADKMMDLVLREARSAVIESDAETQSLLRFNRPGTIGGAVGASMFQFKSFPAALLMDQGRRIGEISQRKGVKAAGAYAASFVVGMTMFGAISLQLKEMLKGKDFRPMDNGEFWIDAMVQGGGLGIFGDIIGNFANDRLNGAYELVGGPVVGAVEDTRDWAASFFPNEDGETKAGAATARMAQRYTPGTSIWWLRAALQRYVWDELAERIDPNYADAQARLEERAASQGQEYYWPHGEPLPTRAPRLPASPQ